MRAYCILILSCLCISFSSHAQWQWLNPTPNGYYATKILFTDSKTGFVMNYNGDLFVTHDQGGQWALAQHFVNSAVMDIKDSTGVIAGYNFVSVSRDNGATWKSITPPAQQTFSMVSIVNRNVFFIGVTLGNIGNIYRTDDGGLTWKTLSPGGQFFVLQFVNAKTGFAGGSGGLIKKTKDGGNTWDTVHTARYTPSGIKSIQFLDTSRGYAFMEYDTVLITKDGGATWKTAAGKYDMEAIFFADSTTGYAAGDDGAITKSTDGGKTWNWSGFVNALIYGNTLTSLYFLGADTGFAVGGRGRILKTENGGLSWKAYSPFYEDVSSIHFPTVATGYVTAGKSIYKTTDTGRTWKPQGFTASAPYPDYSSFNYCHFSGRDTGIVFETNSLRLCTTYDGGATWSVSNAAPNSYTNVSDVCFYNDSSAYAIFYDQNSSVKSLFRTTDRGLHFSLVNMYIDPTKICFIDGKTGYGTVYQQLKKTVDSGKTWTTVYTNGSQYFNHVWFVSPAKGFLAGDSRYLAQTTDSGKTWTPVNNLPQQVYSDFTQVKFYNKKIGYILADYAVVLRTQDGGTTWSVDAMLANSFNAIDFAPDSTVYIAGVYGDILRSPLGRYQADSIRVYQNAYCKGQVAAYISSVMKPVDSLFFEYGKRGVYNRTVKATPFSVTDTAAWVTAPMDSLVWDSMYTVRVKLYAGGQAYYPAAASVVFYPSAPAKPVITARGDTLFSSSGTTTQWFLNGNPIAGATGRQLIVGASGMYTVVVTGGDCPGRSSDPYNFVYTALQDLSPWNGSIVIYPNPVDDRLYIVNNDYRQISLALMDAQGRTLLLSRFSGRSNAVPVQSLAPGVYIVQLTDLQKHERVSRIIVKK